MTDQVETDTATEEAGPSIEETMEAAFDAAQAEPESETPEPEPESPPEPEAEVEPDAEESTPEETAEKTEPEQTEQAATAPASWTAEAKAKFNELPPDIQSEVIKRERDFEAGLRKNAEAAKLAEAYEGVVAPYKAMIAAEGGTPVGAMQDLLNTAYQLRVASPEQKKSLLMGIARDYGIDLGSETKQEEDVFVDPELKATQDRLNQLENYLRQREMEQVTAQQQTVDQQIQSFAADPKHTHFEAVKPEMAALLQAGRAESLEDAYQKAIWANPEVRSTILAEQQKEAEAKRIAEAKKVAAQAKKQAGANIRSRSTAEAVPRADSIDETMSRVYDEHNS